VSLGQEERDPTGRFLRGLTLGALLGAIIAGSSIWTKAKARRATGPSPRRVGAERSGPPPVADPPASVDPGPSVD
jgi:hypothetical protein